MDPLLRAAVGAVLICCFPAVGCAGPAGTDPYEIPKELRETYAVDCPAYCAAEAPCLAWPDDRHCRELCQCQVQKGAFQAAYVEGRHACVRALPATCSQSDLDGCWSQALAACAPPASLEALEQAWCTRWLTCSGASPDTYLARCIDDLHATPDHALFPCFNAAALEQLDLCLAAADCAEIESLPLLTICAEVFR